MIDYDVKRISASVAKEYIKAHHYTHGCHNGPSPCYGLFDGENLIGVLMFATPAAESVREMVFGSEYKNGVVELHRLHILDVTPRNTESWFISRCLDLRWLLSIDRRRWPLFPLPIRQRGILVSSTGLRMLCSADTLNVARHTWITMVGCVITDRTVSKLTAH